MQEQGRFGSECIPTAVQASRGKGEIKKTEALLTSRRGHVCKAALYLGEREFDGILELFVFADGELLVAVGRAAATLKAAAQT